MKPILLVDFGSTYTKVTAVDLDKEMILGTARSHTTIESDITIGLNKAMDILEEGIGHHEWVSKLGCSSAAGGLKMVAVGLVPELTVKAARTAALSAGAKVIGTYSYKLNTDEMERIERGKPDILLLSGGTDGGNEEVVLHNARCIAGSGGTYPVIYAGNKCPVTQIREIFERSPKDLIVTANVMPSMEILATEEVKAVIADLFISRIIEAKGLKKAEDFLDNILMPTPTAVMKAAELMAKGTRDQKGIGDLMVVDMGGATTDIHSACDGYPTHGNTVLKGLREPYMKRTVEGDLGARYSLRALVESVGIDMVAARLGWTGDNLLRVIESVEANPDTIAEEGSDLMALDEISSVIAVYESTRRHCGTVASHYTPFGQMFEQQGKDLSTIGAIIGTGGPIIHNRDPKGLLGHMSFDKTQPMSLRPKAGTFYLDKSYIMAAMGILASKYPETALKRLKNEIIEL